MKHDTRLSCDEVLEAFAFEPDMGRPTVEKYLRDYPEYAESILDCAAELSREDVVRQGPLTLRESALIETGWKKHVHAAPKAVVDPFAALSGVQLGEVAAFLEVPKQVLTALRDRAVVMASIPTQFLNQLAAEIRSDLDTLMAFLAAPPTSNVSRSHKSDVKPKAVARKTFEQILTDAGVAPEVRTKLLVDH